MTGTVDFVAQRNATFRRIIIWKTKDNEDPPNVSIVNNSGFKAKLQVRTYPNGPVITEIHTASDDPKNKITMGGANGQIVLLLDEDTTQSLRMDDLFYDLIIEDTAGDVFRLIEGKFTIVDAITLGRAEEED